MCRLPVARLRSTASAKAALAGTTSPVRRWASPRLNAARLRMNGSLRGQAREGLPGVLDGALRIGPLGGDARADGRDLALQELGHPAAARPRARPRRSGGRIPRLPVARPAPEPGPRGRTGGAWRAPAPRASGLPSSARRRSRPVPAGEAPAPRPAAPPPRSPGPTGAWPIASSTSPCCSYHWLARRCSSGTLPGSSASRRPRRHSANRWW